MKASNLLRLTRAIRNVIEALAPVAADNPPPAPHPEPAPVELAIAHLVTILRNPHYLDDRRIYAKCGVCNRATAIPYAELGDRAEGWAADDLTSCTGVVHVVDGASGGRS